MIEDKGICLIAIIVTKSIRSLGILSLLEKSLGWHIQCIVRVIYALRLWKILKADLFRPLMTNSVVVSKDSV